MSNRLLRVNELLQRETSAFLRKRYTSEAVGITITSVEITGDLREAKVYYSVLGDDTVAEKTGKWLRGRRDEIREMLAKNVIIRHVPLLTFVHDNHAPRTLRVETLLGEIDRETPKP
ncbi:Ribosome-binding factor A [Lacunisphaera limnophila]|jgi:ribosome-binding factor A|uniref:Ribosome-binding factor A n=1 Tax=Lacunisphaera limnophila TaxID=1838286 RepID=A0A1I7PHA8_9BACT|nr:30S ribosome-binding factor RbfA [Lacunisphaera limnophila]AOS42982.1 Ribosome-binding factor A [Lacunisphaera limnophila]